MKHEIPIVSGLRAIALLSLLLVAVMVVGGCAHQPVSANVPIDRLWQSGDQFVAIVPREQPSANALNEHPGALDQVRLRGLLATLGWQEKPDETPVPLFTDYELSILSEQIGSGLARASADQELAFALIGNHRALMGLARQRLVTTGRVFLAQGRLHLILGMVHEDVRDNEDRRLRPFVPGTRATPAALSGRVTVLSAVGEKQRPDWLVIDPAAELPKPSVVHPGSGDGNVPAADAVPPRKQNDQTGRDTKRIEERLLLLQGLKEKGLITEQEYRSKRQEILGDI